MFKPDKIQFAENVVNEVNKNGYSGLILCKYSGINAKKLCDLRAMIRQAGCKMKMGGNGVLLRGFEAAENKGIIKQNLSNTMVGFKGQMALVLIKDDILAPLAVLTDSAHKKRLQIEVIGAHFGNSIIKSSILAGLAKYKSSTDVILGIYTTLVTPIFTLVIALEKYYKLTEGNQMTIEQEKLTDVIEALNADAGIKDLVRSVFNMSQAQTCSLASALKTVLIEGFGLDVGAMAVGTGGGDGASGNTAEAETKKDYKLKVVNIDSAQKLAAARLIQEAFAESGKKIEKLTEASQQIAVGNVLDINPMASDKAQEWIDKFATLGVIVEKI